MDAILQFLQDNLVLVFALLATILYYCTTYSFNYWAALDVKYFPPVPLFGNSFKTALSITPISERQQEVYNYFAGHPYGGTWTFLKPKLMIRDPKLIEAIMIKDFPFFTDRETTVPRKGDPFAKHLVNLNGNVWKSLRMKLTPVFSSGKMKSMLQQITDCSDRLVEYIGEKSSSSPIEVRDTIAGFTMDVIGSCAFGLDLQSLKDPNSEFRIMGRRIFSPSKGAMLRLALRSQFGKILRYFKWGAMPSKMQQFFINTVKNTVKYREDNNIYRADFIQLMMEVRKEEEKLLKENSNAEALMDDDAMTANAFVFLLAGYETTASTISYTLYELSRHEDIQDKVYNDVVETLKKHKNEISWEALKDMTYVEQVLKETLRIHPPAVSLSRQAVKSYKFPDCDLELPAKSVVTVPIYALHHDPQYYPEPKKFNPERFSEANKDKIVKGTYLPFGDGPRICIGMRFAKVEMKVAIIKLILKYKFKLNSRTISPLKYSPQAFLLAPTGGIWIDFIPRT